MRTLTLAALVSVAIAISTAPADAAWKSYISKDLVFSFKAPGQVEAERGTYRGAIAGPRQTIVFKSTEDNIEYKVTVMSFAQAQAEGAILLGERQYMFQQNKKILTDAFSRVGAGKDSVYGRRIVADLPMNKGRTTGAFYFTNGKLYTLEATVLPANGNYASPDPGRFIDSIEFALSHTEPGAVELHAPKVE
jgi:hypothetical protein